jgi:hypothetical protein
VFLKIHLFTIKNTFLCFNIHTYPFQIHYNTFQKPYISLTYIIIPLIYSNILSYTSIQDEHVLKPLYSAPFCFVTTLFFETVMVPHNSTKMSCTCYDMFTGIQKWSIFHESHKSYWFIKYLNPKLIAQNTINTCWTYIHQYKNYLWPKGCH